MATFDANDTAADVRTRINAAITTADGIEAGTTDLTVATLSATGQVIFNEAGAAVDFRVEGDTATHLLFVDGSADRVGVNTSTPVAPLDVSGNIAITAATTEDRAINIGLGRSGDGSALIDFIGDATYTDYGLRIIRDGTANGSSTIAHRGTGAFTIDADEAAAIAFKTNSVERVSIGATGDVTLNETGVDQDFRVETTASTHTFFVQGSNGRVGIGTSTPGYSLDLNGDLFNTVTSKSAMVINRSGTDGALLSFFKSLSGVGSISVTGSATSYNTSSDYRLKENVEPLTGAAARVLALKPSRFNWIADPDGDKVDGFIAHEAAGVVPEAVHGEKDGDDMQGIDQSKLVPLLTAALQEALTRIAALEAQ
jgi:hypothetical protein